MDKLKPFFLFILLFVFILSPGCKKDDADTVLAKHEARYPDIRKKYIYQSVIRLANLKHDPDFDKLIKDVRKITIYMPPSDDSTYQIKEVSKGIAADGFEQLMEVRSEGTGRISLWEKETKSSSHFIGFLDTETDDIIFEIDGQLNLKYISALKFADEGSLMDLIK
ncbi:MAG TPA: DUF4252 domain-containing protein [Saprospiraceae bacterium]|nr:DUF4252 domain-containing protein [Saprospiraceae bacterium]